MSGWDSELNWESIKDQASLKYIVCRDSTERKNILWELSSVFDKEIGIKFRMNGPSYSVRVHDTLFNKAYEIQTISTISHCWYSRLRGLEISEVLATTRSLKDLNDTEEIDILRGRIRAEGCDVFEKNLLSFTLRGRSRFLEEVSPDSRSLTDSFNFPISLFRRGMVEYFEDPFNPTREEFLFAVMMEGIGGKTSEEIRAINDAKVYIEGKGN
ncbi:hypothetical protein [Salmonella phage SSBI34]|nr:hypothetical protein [Salmonella phage SSBI34]